MKTINYKRNETDYIVFYVNEKGKAKQAEYKAFSKPLANQQFIKDHPECEILITRTKDFIYSGNQYDKLKSKAISSVTCSQDKVNTG